MSNGFVRATIPSSPFVYASAARTSIRCVSRPCRLAVTESAKNGELKPASLFKGNGPIAGRPVVKPETARAVRHMLELAVQPGGTAPRAQVAGYRVGGKTGTAHKLQGRGYGNKYVSSFVGFAPIRDPQMIMLVKLDFREDRLGGQVSAPVFAELAPAILTYRGVRPDDPALVDAPRTPLP